MGIAAASRNFAFNGGPTSHDKTGSRLEERSIDFLPQKWFLMQ
jgi:hypothetical protein